MLRELCSVRELWSVTTDSRLPAHSSGRGRSRIIGASLSALIAAAGLTGLTPAPASAGTLGRSVSVGTGKVIVDNLSTYTDNAAADLTRRANVSMATQNPVANPSARGQMSNGDRIVVTNFGLYWLDIKDRGGLLTGMWPLKATTGSSADFANKVNDNGWAPNHFAPGSDGGTISPARPYDTGQSVNVLPTGGADASCTPGKGTFIISNSANCNYPHGPVNSTLAAVSANGIRKYTFSGTLYQEGTGSTTMIDADGRSASVKFDLTYHFWTNPTSATEYAAGAGPDQQRVRTELQLTPSAPIDLGTVVVAGVSDYTGMPYRPRAHSVGSMDRPHYKSPDSPGYTPCGPNTIVTAGQLGSLCFGPEYDHNYMVTDNRLPTTLLAGDYVTQRNTADPSTATRQMTYLVPDGPLQKPARFDHIWNTYLGVGAFDADFFNSDRQAIAPASPFRGAFDIQLAAR